MERFVLVMCQALGNWIEAAESDFENVFQVSADQPPGNSHHDDASHDDDDDDDDSDTLTLCDEADEFGDVLLETLDTDTETDTAGGDVDQVSCMVFVEDGQSEIGVHV